MVLRSSTSYRGNGEPLTGVLRDLDRRTRAVQRARPRVPEAERHGPPGPQGEPGPAGRRGDPGEPGPPGPGVQSTILTTDSGGAATWGAGDEVTVIATAVSTEPVLTTLTLTGGAVTVHTWTVDGEAAPDITVHLIATPT